MRMMQFTPSTSFTCAPLGLAIATSLLLAATPNAQAIILVGNGQTVTLNPGDPREGDAAQVSGGTLIVNGAAIGEIQAAHSSGNPAQLLLSNATVNTAGSTVTNGLRNSTAIIQDSTINGRFALATDVGANSLPRSKLTAIRSSFGRSGLLGLGANAGATLESQGSTFRGTSGISIGGAVVNLRAGSTVIGDTSGLNISYNSTASGRADNQATWGVLIDASRVESGSGPAILVRRSDINETVRITAQNGASLIGGNGVMIEARDNALLDFTARTSTLKGDITIADTATAKISLLDGLDLTGRILGPADVIVDQGGRWTLSGDSNTGNLTLGAGSDIFLGAAGTAAYPQLTVNGNYAGNGGTLHFNTVLAGDDAASSRMHVTGDTSGTTQVTVNNIAGAGAQTVNGIPLVQVDGASNGHLALQGRAIGGMYEYFLRKGTPGATNGNWYLTSAYTGNPCDINPALPECKPVDPTDPTDPVDPVDPEVPVDPVPVLRPEPGAYLANQAAAVQMFQLRRHDRGEPGFDRARIGTWVRAGRDQLQANVAGQVDARTHINTLQLGSDVWRWGDGRGQVGVMLGTGEATTQAVSTLSGYGTRGKVKGKSAGVYLGWVQDAQSSAGLYVDGWLQAARFDNEVQGEGIARETYDSRTRSASLEAGYAWAIRSSEASTLYLQPQAQLTWTDYDGDSLVENNGTTVEDGRGGGLNSRLGVRLFGQSTLQGNRVQPFLAANWLRGQRDEAMRFNSESLNAKTPENRYEVQAGAQLQLGQRWSAWGDLRVQRGDSGYRNHGAQVGLRAAW
ncbi:autotransporter outer membrane beta-barrel domain-containing protein [Stenotrophomonas maltophilia]|uniref:autotransporter family protein n=2 Tax=Stenotrophomonas maltophilia TaxID=40324 RepID=UPI0013DA1FBB|nr:autotransporter outer membrane beta-barrel domain-containing protein [Stenotrophomonas maltophilia]